MYSCNSCNYVCYLTIRSIVKIISVINNEMSMKHSWNDTDGGRMKYSDKSYHSEKGRANPEGD